MRPSFLLFLFIALLLMVDSAFWLIQGSHRAEFTKTLPSQKSMVAQLGLSDLVLSTEARYTRHPALTDPMAAFMDHPGSIEHFPSGSFILPENISHE